MKYPVSSRRNFIKKASSASLAALGGLHLASSAGAMSNGSRPVPVDGIARGKVFLDAKETGQAEGQRGLAGMLVSNGTDIAMTDREGRYELPVSEDTIIFVIKPRNYRTAVDDLNLPRFYYIHKPDGSPDEDFIYKGIEPTGPLPASIDFPLYPSPEGDQLKVLLTADPQSYNLEHLKWYGEEAIREFRELDVACGIALGDIVGDHLVLLDEYNRINSRAGFPWYNVVGNHDFNFMAKEDRYVDETFKRIFGPTTYAFQRGPVHFIVLNNVYWEGFDGFLNNGWPQRRQYFGHLRDWQLQFVRNYLKFVSKDERIAVCTHIPLVTLPHVNEMHRTRETKELMKILSSHPHTVSFSGHNHYNTNYILGKEMGYNPPGGGTHHHFNLTATCGSWYRGPYDHAGIPMSRGRDFSPKGYAVASFDGGSDYHIRFKGLGFPEDYQMNIAIPRLVTRKQLGTQLVQANVFNGSANTRARMRFDGGEWLPMKQAMTIDPDYVALRERNKLAMEGSDGLLMAPVDTDHHWVAAIPESLANGWYEVEVEATDHFGGRWTDVRVFVVSDRAEDLHHLSQGTRTRREV